MTLLSSLMKSFKAEIMKELDTTVNKWSQTCDLQYQFPSKQLIRNPILQVNPYYVNTVI